MHAFLHVDHAGANIRNAIDRHHASRATANATEESSGAMIFHTAAEDPHPVGVESRGNSFICISLYWLAFEIEGNLFPSIESENWVFRDPAIHEFAFLH